MASTRPRGEPERHMKAVSMLLALQESCARTSRGCPGTIPRHPTAHQVHAAVIRGSESALGTPVSHASSVLIGTMVGVECLYASVSKDCDGIEGL